MLESVSIAKQFPNRSANSIVGHSSMEDHAAGETSSETCGILIWLLQAMAYLDVSGNTLLTKAVCFLFFEGFVRSFALEN